MQTENGIEELLTSAREFFRGGRYTSAEPLLNQLILKGAKDREIFHMLGTIYYDQGKFNKAIRSFKRALEIDPSFTDASVGLSIILNDLGRYEEGKKIFDEAKQLLTRNGGKEDPYVNEKLALKHDELGELYFRYQRYMEALDQYFKALSLSARKPELTMKVVECHLRLNEGLKATKELHNLLQNYPNFHSARLKLGVLLYEAGDVALAVEEWERILERQPDHSEAKRLLNLAQVTTKTNRNESEISL
ncbi:MAG: tetratricopeptide repeat protein [Bdellovibrionales bacterium]|nr:tetratricopeptide repeat protein [Bdellovibrionales bacterium]